MFGGIISRLGYTYIAIKTLIHASDITHFIISADTKTKNRELGK